MARCFRSGVVLAIFTVAFAGCGGSKDEQVALDGAKH